LLEIEIDEPAAPRSKAGFVRNEGEIINNLAAFKWV